MDHATDKSVLGDFNDADFNHYGVRSRFFRKDGKLFVETDGPDGRLADFEVKYTFGIDPLQQYLIEFPDGRLQALSIAWDSRRKESGGQRWFHLYPDEPIRHDDVLHWTKLNQNWNFMCAECHSTGVRKNYDPAADRFATTWAELHVGCEACHGQGSRHVAWARGRQGWWPFGKTDHPSRGLLVHFDERSNIGWTIDQAGGRATRSGGVDALRKEVETCGRCHARRGVISEDWFPGRWLSDTHVVSPLARGVHEADGQMRNDEEVYNYSQFKQSKMFAAGVTCSNCHDPHSAKPYSAGNGVCLQCHAPAKYEATAHHRHAAATPPLACKSCHMPARTYMVVDRRHDHSFRVPRPDLSVRLRTPNACNDCHSDRTAEWAASAVERWHGPRREGADYAEALHSAWTGQQDAEARLTAIAADRQTPAFVRASALLALSDRMSRPDLGLLRASLADPDPMVRIGALDAIENIHPAQTWGLVSPLLSDSVRGVRMRAAALAAGLPDANMPPADRARFERAAAELVAAYRRNADRPEARSALGNFLARRGRSTEAEEEFTAALRLDPRFTPAAINLADLYRQLGRDQEGVSALRSAIVVAPADAGLHHALGLALVRLKRSDDAIQPLHRAAELDPRRARYAYVHAVALHSAGRRTEAMAALQDALAKHPDNRDILTALTTFSREAGELMSALAYAEQLAKLIPDDRGLANLVQELKRELAGPGSGDK